MQIEQKENTYQFPINQPKQINLKNQLVLQADKKDEQKSTKFKIDNALKKIQVEREKRARGEKNCFANLLMSYIKGYINSDKYRNDIRYLKLWCMRADIEENQQKSDEIFKTLESKQIGVNYSLLYECWALKLESQGRIAESLQQYLKGRKQLTNEQQINQLDNSIHNFLIRRSHDIFQFNSQQKEMIITELSQFDEPETELNIEQMTKVKRKRENIEEINELQKQENNKEKIQQMNEIDLNQSKTKSIIDIDQLQMFKRRRIYEDDDYITQQTQYNDQQTNTTSFTVQTNQLITILSNDQTSLTTAQINSNLQQQPTSRHEKGQDTILQEIWNMINENNKEENNNNINNNLSNLPQYPHERNNNIQQQHSMFNDTRLIDNLIEKTSKQANKDVDHMIKKNNQQQNENQLNSFNTQIPFTDLPTTLGIDITNQQYIMNNSNICQQSFGDQTNLIRDKLMPNIHNNNQKENQINNNIE